jgi:hypothetical protein
MALSRAVGARRRDALAAERAALAFRARADRGLTYSEIGQELGISTGAAFKAFQRGLTAVRELVDPDEARVQTDLVLHRLDRAVGVASTIMDDPTQPADTRLRAVDRVVRVEQRRAQLLGLDRPVRAELGVRPMPPQEVLSHEEVEQELESLAHAIPGWLAVHRGVDSVIPPAVD